MSSRRKGAMRVAYMLDAFPVLSETFIVREILELRRSGFEVPIYALTDTRTDSRGKIVHSESAVLDGDVLYAREIRNRVSKVRQVLLHLRYFLRNPLLYSRLLRMCRRTHARTFYLFGRSVLYASLFEAERIEHVHAHFCLRSCTLAMLISAWSRIPFSFTVHAHDIFIPGLAELMEEKLRRARFVVSISEYNKKHLLKAHPSADPDRIQIVHCGIDVERFAPPASRHNRTFTMLAVGRLHEQKGFEHLVRACGLLKRERGIDFVCDILGEGEERPRLEALIREEGVESEVRLAGAVDQSRVRAALDAADIFVLPCVAAKSGAMDGIPVALMEAMATELPVISTRISGIPELVGPGGGIVVEPGDARPFCDAIASLAGLSAGERGEMGSKGRATVEREYNLKTEVGKLAELFLTSAGRSAGQRRLV